MKKICREAKLILQTHKKRLLNVKLVVIFLLNTWLTCWKLKISHKAQRCLLFTDVTWILQLQVVFYAYGASHSPYARHSIMSCCKRVLLLIHLRGSSTSDKFWFNKPIVVFKQIKIQKSFRIMDVKLWR